MKWTAPLALALTAFFFPAARAADEDTRVYELRIYTAAPGKLDALHARFRDHTTKLFEKHGMTNVGYWNLLEGPERAVISLISFLSRKSADDRRAAFDACPQ